jgi:hypothetical protein
MAVAAGTYRMWPEIFSWEGRENGVSGRLFHHKNRHSPVKHGFQVDDLAPEQWVEFLKEVSVLFEVDFACAHVYGKGNPETEDRKLMLIDSPDLQTWLPSVPWIACFGPPYLEMFGKTKLMAAPFAAVERLGNDLVFTRLVDDPSQCIERAKAYRALRAKIKAALGLQYFFDPDQPKKKAVVPKFGFPQS